MKYLYLFSLLFIFAACTLQDKISEPPLIAGYATSELAHFAKSNSFNLSKNIQFSFNQPNATINISVIGEQYVYKKAYYYDGKNISWVEFNFSEPTVNSSNWIDGNASYDFFASQELLNLTSGNKSKITFASYSCSKIGTSWNCHNNKWVITEMNFSYQNKTCYDFEPIQNTSIQGNVTGIDGNASYYVYIDHCLNETHLMKYFCDSKFDLSESVYFCSKGCQLGKCSLINISDELIQSNLTNITQPTQNLTNETTMTSSKEIRVLSIIYFPMESTGQLNTSITGWVGTTNVSQLKNQITKFNYELSEALENGSRYHNQDNYLNYSLYENKIYYKETPKYKTTPTSANHQFILKNEGFDICDYVDNQSVKEVWLWMYHTGTIYPVESYQRGPGHQFGNGYMDLPLCKKSYTVYDYNYGRSLAEALEDHTHHLESLFRYIDYEMWQSFSGEYAEFLPNNKITHYDNSSAVYACGWTHCTPNGIISVCNGTNCVCDGYNWYLNRNVLSNCQDWGPNDQGLVQNVSCLTWQNSFNSPYKQIISGRTCPYDDGGVAFKVWWMQNLPGYNNTKYSGSKKVRNFWDFVADFDNAISQGKCFAC